MPRGLGGSALMKPFVVLALPGMYLFYKYSQYKRQQLEQNRRKVTERELAHLNNKIDKLLTTLEENEPEIASTQEDECVICVNAKASMETWPCGHRVVCRKCFVKTIQVAVSQRLLPLRCVICRAKILRLKQTLASSASDYSITHVHNSESLYSMASASSSISGCSSTSMSSTGSSMSSKLGNGRHTLRQPQGTVLRKTQTHSMKYHLQEYKEPVSSMRREDKPPRLTPIQEFQREYRLGKERSSSTRIRCAQKIVTQLESSGAEANNTSPQPAQPSNSRRSSHGFSFGKTNCSQLQKKAQKEEQKRQKNLVKKIARLEAEEAREAAAATAATNPSSSSEQQPSASQDSKNKKDKNKQEKKDKEKKETEKKENKKENKKESKSEKKSNKNKESKSNSNSKE